MTFLDPATATTEHSRPTWDSSAGRGRACLADRPAPDVDRVPCDIPRPGNGAHRAGGGSWAGLAGIRITPAILIAVEIRLRRIDPAWRRPAEAAFPIRGFRRTGNPGAAGADRPPVLPGAGFGAPGLGGFGSSYFPGKAVPRAGRNSRRSSAVDPGAFLLSHRLPRIGGGFFRVLRDLRPIGRSLFSGRSSAPPRRWPRTAFPWRYVRTAGVRFWPWRWSASSRRCRLSI